MDSNGNLNGKFMSEESMGAKERSWASIQLGTESDHKENEKYLKT